MLAKESFQDRATIEPSENSSEVYVSTELGKSFSEQNTLTLLQAMTPTERSSRAQAIFLELKQQERLEEAVMFLDMAWRIGTRDINLFIELVDSLQKLGRTQEVVARCREAAFYYMSQNQPELTMLVANLKIKLGDESYDYVLYSCLERVFSGYQVAPRQIRTEPPYKVGYVLWGECQHESTLPGLFFRIAQAQDRSIFEPIFFSLNPRASLPLDDASSVVSKIVAAGFKLQINPTNSPNAIDRVVSLAEEIRRQEIDLVVFQSQFPHYCATALLRPAPIVSGFDHGNPNVYTSPALDYAFSTVPRHSVEHPCNSILLTPAFLSDPIGQIEPLDKASIEVPESAPLIVTTGLPTKFDAKISGVFDFFAMVGDVLADNPTVYWCIIGVAEEEIPYLLELLSSSCRERVRCVGHVPDINPYLKIATVYLDTFPIAGGLSIHQAMALGVPTFTYRIPFDGRFDKSSKYSVMGDLLPDRSILWVEPTTEAIGSMLRSTLADPELRNRLSIEGKVLANYLGDRKRFVSDLEARYLEIIKQAQQ
jgi:glycosyltransferase involved in cell wall biosynthesis